MPHTDDTLLEEKLAFVRRELIRVANRHDMTARQVKDFIVRTVQTYGPESLWETVYVEGTDLEFTYGSYRRMLDNRNREE